METPRSDPPQDPAPEPPGGSPGGVWSPSPPGTERCWRCHRTIPVDAKFCPHCGRKQAKSQWYYRPIWILVLAFLVIGPLALPLVWRSPFMSRPVKWVLSIAITLYFAVTIYFMLHITTVFLDYFQETQEELQSFY